MAFSVPTSCLTGKWDQDYLPIQAVLGWRRGQGLAVSKGELLCSLARPCAAGGTRLCLGACIPWQLHGHCRQTKRGLHAVVGRIRTCAGKPQWISSPSPSPLGHNYLLQTALLGSSSALCNDDQLPGTLKDRLHPKTVHRGPATSAQNGTC